MRINGRQTLYFGWLLLLMACVKPYDFEQKQFEKILVVDGLLTDEPGTASVHISYTYPLDTSKREYVNAATVWVENATGERMNFDFVAKGEYRAAANAAGAVGGQYRLFIEMPDGTRYTSSEETLLSAPPIDSIYGRYAELPSQTGDANIAGIQFFIDTHDDTRQARHFRYEWEEAYKIVVPYPARYEVLPDSSIVPMNPSIGICYREGRSNTLNFGGITSSQNRLAEFPIRFASVDMQQLRSRYAILVKQYAITETAYLFYKELQQSNESGGSLFDRQNGSVFGNIYRVSEGQESVLGFFEVSGYTSTRRFFNNSELDERLPRIRFPYLCLAEDLIQTEPDSALFWVERTDGNIFDVSATPPTVYIGVRSCTDCSFYASVTPPDFWID